MSGKYSKAAGAEVARAVGEFERGSLKSGPSKQPVKSRKQAVAIGLSEARRAGKKVPTPRTGGQAKTSRQRSR